MKYLRYGSAAIVLAAVLWGLDGLLRRYLYEVPAPVIVFWEHIFGFIILLPIIIASYRAFKQLTRKQWLAITGVAFLSGAVGTILYTAALGRVQAIDFSVVILLQQLNPIFAIVTAALLLHEPLTRRFFGLAALALVGGYFISFSDPSISFSTHHDTMIAALFAIGAAAAWGISTTFSKYALRGTSSLHITALRFGITPLFALLFVMLSGNTGNLDSLTAKQFGIILAITFSTGLVALAIYYFGLKRVMASRAAILGLARPLVAVIIGYLFLDEQLTATQAMGGLILTGAIYQIARDAAKLSEAKKAAA